jgi:hypothetical protein
LFLRQGWASEALHDNQRNCEIGNRKHAIRQAVFAEADANLAPRRFFFPSAASIYRDFNIPPLPQSLAQYRFHASPRLPEDYPLVVQNGCSGPQFSLFFFTKS